MGQPKSPNSAELLLWSIGGLVAGLAAGVALSGWAGVVTRERVRRVAGDIRRPVSPSRTGRAAMVEAAQAILGQDPLLSTLDLRVRAVGAHSLELRGWVPDRALRARASRVIRQVDAVEMIINNVLVRGEDDRLLALVPPSDQSA